MRKPRKLELCEVYAAIGATTDPRCFVYIGGRYYDDHAQIHLNKPEFLKLADWMTKAAAWVRATKPKGGRK